MIFSVLSFPCLSILVVSKCGSLQNASSISRINSSRSAQGCGLSRAPVALLLALSKDVPLGRSSLSCTMIASDQLLPPGGNGFLTDKVVGEHLFSPPLASMADGNSTALFGSITTTSSWLSAAPLCRLLSAVERCSRNGNSCVCCCCCGDTASSAAVKAQSEK